MWNGRVEFSQMSEMYRRTYTEPRGENNIGAATGRGAEGAWTEVEIGTTGIGMLKY